jgi:tetratricopeptide (TPR) repeat protein
MNDIQERVISKISDYMKISKYREALRELIQYRRAFPREYREKVVFLRGYLSLKAGDIEVARKIFERLSVNSPQKSLYHYFLGMTNLEMAEYRQSLENFQKALNIVPESREYLKNYAWTLVMTGKKKGLLILEDLFRKDSSDRDLVLKYILSLLKFHRTNLAMWIAEIGYRKFGEEEFQGILKSIKDPEVSGSMFLREKEEKVLVLVNSKSGLEQEMIDEIAVLFLTLKDRVFRRIIKPEPWAAALEIAGRILLGDGLINKREITRKYKVKSRQVDRILGMIFSGGAFHE